MYFGEEGWVGQEKGKRGEEEERSGEEGEEEEEGRVVKVVFVVVVAFCMCRGMSGSNKRGIIRQGGVGG